MAICGGCGAERTRTRTIFKPDGTVHKEECQSCAPGSFDPSWLTSRGVPAYEAYPEKYTKITNQDGSITYRSTDEWRQDSEDKLRKGYEKVDAADASAVEEKRRNRRTKPLTAEEITAATNRWQPYLEERTKQANRQRSEAIKELIQ